jgi:hypothetical protein
MPPANGSHRTGRHNLPWLVTAFLIATAPLTQVALQNRFGRAAILRD